MQHPTHPKTHHILSVARHGPSAEAAQHSCQHTMQTKLLLSQPPHDPLQTPQDTAHQLHPMPSPDWCNHLHGCPLPHIPVQSVQHIGLYIANAMPPTHHILSVARRSLGAQAAQHSRQHSMQARLLLSQPPQDPQQHPCLLFLQS